MPKNYKSRPRIFGKDSRACRVTNSTVGIIRKYGLMMSRRAFREYAKDIGFTKTR